MKARLFTLSVLAFVSYSLGSASATRPGDRSSENPKTMSTSDVQRIEFREDELPRNLYSLFTGTDAPSCLQYRLPERYSHEKRYPLLLYVPGSNGQPGGEIQNAIDIAGGRECVVASLPLFKQAIDRTEPAGGLIIGFSDYPVLSSAYRTMLERLYKKVPNIDPDASAMVGFSNGAVAIAVLVSSHDRYILDRFHSFCLVDQGMFNLTDLYKAPTKDRRFLMLVGDKEALGRDLQIRGARLVEDIGRLVGADVESRVMPNTGHELTRSCKLEIGKWVFGDSEAQKGGPAEVSPGSPRAR